VHKVSDRTFLRTWREDRDALQGAAADRDDLSMALHPGVGRVALAIAGNRKTRAA